VPELSWSAILVDGATLSAALTVVILGSLAYNPRLWLQDAPPRVRSLAPPLTDAERRKRLVVAALLFLVIAGVTVWSASRLIARNGPAVPYVTAFGHFAGVFLLFNLFDLIVLDWFVVLVVKPPFLRRFSVPGLSYEETVGSFGYHLMGFVKGLGFVVVMSAIAATAVFVMTAG